MCFLLWFLSKTEKKHIFDRVLNKEWRESEKRDVEIQREGRACCRVKEINKTQTCQETQQAQDKIRYLVVTGPHTPSNHGCLMVYCCEGGAHANSRSVKRCRTNDATMSFKKSIKLYTEWHIIARNVDMMQIRNIQYAHLGVLCAI